jgi:histidine ammonia-lyase
MDVARALLLLRAQTLAVGHSGCRPEILAALGFFFYHTL